MLPEFPKTARDLLKIAALRIYERRKELSPITDIGIQTVAHEGRDFSYEQEGTGVVSDKYQEFKIPVEVKFDEIPTLIGRAFQEKLDAIANEQARQMSAFVYSRIDETITKAGNQVQAGNQLPSKETFLEMIGRMELSFNAAGKPDFTFFAHPVMAKHMHNQWKEWEQDEEFMSKYRELLNKKREVFLDRESNRKLVD